MLPIIKNVGQFDIIMMPGFSKYFQVFSSYDPQADNITVQIKEIKELPTAADAYNLIFQLVDNIDTSVSSGSPFALAVADDIKHDSMKQITRTKKLSQAVLPLKNILTGVHKINVTVYNAEGDRITTPPIGNSKETATPIASINFDVETDDGAKPVRLTRPGLQDTTDQRLWDAIKKHSLKFQEYEHFIDKIICVAQDHPKYRGDKFNRHDAKTRSPFVRSEEYNLIKFATEFYMLAKFGLDESELGEYLGSSGKLPYYVVVIDRIRDELRFDNPFAVVRTGNDCDEREEERLDNPFMLELIWSYWMEQGMLVQTMNVINLRFQNIKGSNYIDRLMRFDTDPLRPLSHILWGYIQDEQHRLSMPRRLNEYDHEYGLILTGRAVPRLNPIDTRVKFLEAFHSLLTLCTIYFKESDDTTRIADAFPILNSLKEVHLLLAEGNHNAYGNLTWTARLEMMMQQYILARPEMREFLGGRTMVPYPETWMDRVDTMRLIQGWGGTGITHYYELAIHGELVLLSIRYGNWSDTTLTSFNAANWAQEFRINIQRYIHAYRAVTSVDLAVEQVIQLPNTFAVQPSFLIQQKLLLEERSRRRA